MSVPPVTSNSISLPHPDCEMTDPNTTNNEINPIIEAPTSNSVAQVSTLPPVWLTPASRSSNSPSYRAGHSLAASSGSLYLFGGYCSPEGSTNTDAQRNSIHPPTGTHYNSVHEYNIDTCTWTILHQGCHAHEARTKSLPVPRRHASMVLYAGSLYIYGGFDASTPNNIVLPDLWEFRISSQTWHQLRPTALTSTSDLPQDSSNPTPQQRKSQFPVGRAEHTAIVYKHRMIVFGGYDGKRKLNDTYAYDFRLQQWSRPIAAETNSPRRRCKHSAVLHKDKMYVVGGFQIKGSSNFAKTDMHELDLEKYVWNSISMDHTCPEALQGHKAVVVGDDMYVLGGKVKARSRNIANSGNIPSLHMPFPQASENLAACWPQGMIPVPQPATVDFPFRTIRLSGPQGSDLSTSGLNCCVFRYNFIMNQWSVFETAGTPPAPRQLHAAVAMEIEGGATSIFMYGGTDRPKQTFFDNLYELRGIAPASDSSNKSCQTCSATSRLLEEGKFADVRFIVEGRTIPAHRCILYARSEYFRHMFESSMRETSETDITITDVTYDVFHAVLEYLYSGRFSLTRENLALDLMKAADMFRLDGLRNICAEQVMLSVTIENAALVCQIADTLNAQSLKLYCISFILCNFKAVIKSEAFQSLMRQDPGGLGREILEAYSDRNPHLGAKRQRS